MFSGVNARRASAAMRALGIVVGFSLLCAPFWDRSLVFRDSFLYYSPYKYHIAEALRHGDLYFWNPWQYLGLPFVADIQAGWFYPLNLFYAVLPFEIAHRLFILAHYPLAAFGLDLFLRRRGLGGTASLLAGIGYALSGYMVSQNSNVPYLAAPALAPYAFYFMERALAGKPRAALGTGAVIALQVFAGEPQGAAITALATCVIALLQDRAAAPRLATLRVLVIAFGAAIVLSLVQVLPTLEMLGLAIRHGGLPLGEASFLSFHPGRLIELILPTPFGTICPDYTFWGTFAIDPSPILQNIPWAPTIYMGLPLLALAGLGAASGLRRRRVGLLLGTAAFFLLALGRHTPLFGLVYHVVPGFRFFRYPEKYLAWCTLGLAALAALGFEVVCRRAREKPHTLRTWAVGYLLATLGLGVLGAVAGWSLLATAGGLVSGSAAETAARAHFSIGLRHFFLVNVCAGLLLLIAASGPRRSRIAAILAVILLVADLSATNLATICTAPAGLFEQPSASAACIVPKGSPRLGSFRVLREELAYRDQDTRLGNVAFMSRLSVWDRQTLQPNLGAIAGFESPIGYHENAPVEGLKLLDHARSDIATLYNVEYVIARFDRPPLGRTRSELVCRDPAWDFSVLRLPDVRPRAYWVSRAIAAVDAREAERLVRSEDLAGAVILTGSGFPPEDPAARSHQLVPASPVRYEPDLVDIAVDAPAAGWLVLSDRHYPGWRAWVDGRPAVIEKANVMVRAVRVPAGRSRVLFTFAPSCWRLSASISGIGWIAVFGIALLGCLGSARKP
jgi:hypothetical protein